MPGSSNWDRAKDAFAAALEQPAERREAYLDEVCAGDAALRAEVESLLLAYAQAGTFLVAPAVPPDEPDEANLGRVVGAYRIESCIGRGGMGVVYLARRSNSEFERSVAIKMIRRGMDTSS